MKKNKRIGTMKQFLFLLVCALVLGGCAASRYSSVNKVAPIEGYKYFYVLGTNELVSIDTSVGLADEFGNASARTYINALNPSDVIVGYLMKKGFIRAPKLDKEHAHKTLLVSYGESGRHRGRIAEVTMQFIDASTHELIATTTAASGGIKTDSDKLRDAILKSLENLFE